MSKDYTNQDIINRVQKGDLRAVARLITLIENGADKVKEIQSSLYRSAGRAKVIGITGSPGAGKSTLTDELISNFTSEGKKVGVIAVDPTSPFSGGAVLGDRIRMNKGSEIPGVYIRSMATRGSLGGLSRATLDAVHVLDSAGFDIVIVETVGVGQAEVDIVRLADTCIVVLVPGMGDGVQAFKAGILEIADLFVINKADREGADLLYKDLKVLLSLAEKRDGDWSPTILKTVAVKGDGIEEVVSKIKEHLLWLETTKDGEKKRIRIIKDTIIKLITESVTKEVFKGIDDESLNRYASKCLQRESDPYTIAEQILSDRFRTPVK